jgi:hypothetical protein
MLQVFLFSLENQRGIAFPKAVYASPKENRVSKIEELF